MLSTLVQKELRAMLLSPKFVATFAVCSILMLLSVFTGVQEYGAAVRQYETSTQLSEQQMRQETTWARMTTTVLRQPDPMQIFVGGLTYDIGRWSGISTRNSIKLSGSTYSDDPIFAVFRHIDFAFIVQFILTLFAILFTYDAVNGERESGTLKLVFANAIPRARYLLAKCIGSWLGLVIPICIPIILCMLLVGVMGVSLSAVHWGRLVTFLGISLLLFTFFIVLGVFISSLTRRSSVSFLAALVVWIGFVLIIPRTAVMAADQIVRVPRVAEIEGQRDGYAKDRWATFMEESQERWGSRCSLEELDESERDTELWNRMQEEDSLRRIVEKEIESYETRLQEDLRRRKAAQQHLAFILARFSPASAYQLAAMFLAGTDISLKARYVDAMTAYRTQFNDYVEKKQAETGSTGGVMITMSSESGISITTGRDDVGIDVSEVPRFSPPEYTYVAAVAPIIPDFGILALATMVAFMGAFIAFLRYDVR
ncbi:MAG: ABC transporter permease subunit [Candidatus Zixiibacteriota bacterium]|nr:MAG: ABC transporter permease subunit [candidate division Zixibacteria bacterium]